MKSVTGFFNHKFSIGYSPWLVFAPFALANALLSYFQLPLSGQLWVGLVGLLLPAVLAMTARVKTAPGVGKPGYETELFPRFPDWAFLVLGLLALAPRLYRLTSLSIWPFTDEGYCALPSIRLSHHWTWQFFFSCSQQPPAFNWLLALYFKAIKSSLSSLWLFPALLSFGAVAAGGLAARLRFPKSFSFFCAVILGFSFWPLYAGRTCQAVVLVFFWQCVCLAALAAYWRKRDHEDCWKNALFLGVLNGLGLYCSVAWPLAAFSICLFFLPVGWARPGRKKEVALFWAALLALLLPYVLVSHLERNGDYLKAILFFQPGMDLARQAMDFFSDVRAVFWGFDGRRLYGPVWGGILNPVLGALVFVGLLEMFRARESLFSRWVFLSLAVFLAPAAVARGYDSFRILDTLPLIVVLGAAGLQSILLPLPGRKRMVMLFLVLGFSTGLDFYHLFNRFHRTWGTPGGAWNFGKEYELWKSYEILKGVAGKRGPGALLFDLRPRLDDVTPTIAAYAFDASHNPSLNFEKAAWVAVMVYANYCPFLSKAFPEGTYYWLCRKRPYGGWALGVIPVSPDNRNELRKWFLLNQAMRPVTEEIIDTLPGISRLGILAHLLRLERLARGDPFLESVFWEKVFENRSQDHDAVGCLEAIRECLRNGFPLPEMFNEEGVILADMGKFKAARRAFQRALGGRLNLTPALQNLKALAAAGK